MLKIDDTNRQLVLLRRGGVPELRLARWVQEYSPGYSLTIGVPSSNPAAEATKAAATEAAATEAAARGATAADAVLAGTPGASAGMASGSSQRRSMSPRRAAASAGVAQGGAAGSGAADAAGGTAGGMAAPGMLLTHYAPDLPSFLLRPSDVSAASAVQSIVVTADGVGGGATPLTLSSAAIVDFGGRAAHLASRVSAYRDLSPDGDALAAATGLFEALRWAEERAADGARCVLLPDVLAATAEVPRAPGAGSPFEFAPVLHPEAAPALADRLFRAASGRGAALSPDGRLVPIDTA